MLGMKAHKTQVFLQKTGITKSCNTNNVYKAIAHQKRLDLHEYC